MQLKFFNWEAQDSGRPWEKGSEQDKNGPSLLPVYLTLSERKLSLKMILGG